MAGTDLKNLQLIQDSDDLILNNGVADDSITPDIDNGLRGDNRKTLAFFGVDKFDIIPSGVPSAGEISFNGLNFDTATSILIHKTDAHGIDLSNKLDLIDTDVVLQINDFEGNYGEWVVVSKVDNTTYFTVTVTLNASNPSYTPTSLEGVFRMNGGGGGGSNTNIILNDLTQTGKRVQDLDGNTQEWQNGEFILQDTSLSWNYNSLGNTGTAIDVDLATGNQFEMTATDNFTLTFSNERATWFTIKCIQDVTGTRILTGGAEVKWAGGVVKLLSTTAGAEDIINGWSDGTSVYLSIENDWS
jgi:hypothetical protein